LYARRSTFAACLALCVTAATACAGSGQDPSGATRIEPATTTAGSSPTAPARSAPPSADPAEVHANELGQIPVLMIHQVVQHPTGDFAQSPAQLRATLEYLASHAYLPITANQLVSGKIDIPAGASPVVLTFDDGLASQFQLRADGTVDPNSAVGVLLAVARKYPGFRPVGTMYVNRSPFGRTDATRELRWLVEHGWEIGNHTDKHENLRSLSSAAVQRAIANQDRLIRTLVPGYQVSTLALPYGIMPEPAALAHRGGASGVTYDYRGVMLVGANPAPSPFAADWDPFNIPRIRSWSGRTDYDEDYWMPRLARSRYVSDGDPARISFPRAAATTLAPAYAARANPY
jgi:peptidoglycan/xylan/chitin deacetylase (PgdA/CDA1 family)